MIKTKNICGLNTKFNYKPAQMIKKLIKIYKKLKGIDNKIYYS